MIKLNNKQIESLQEKIKTIIALPELSFDTVEHRDQEGISFVILKRYNYQIKTNYYIVPLELNEQFTQVEEEKFKRITKVIFDNSNANFGLFGKCYFENDEAIECDIPTDYQFSK